jgi:hypothetical protein
MNSKTKKTLIAIAGVPVMIIGLIGWILPFIPGAPVFFVGLAMVLIWHPKGAIFVTKCKDKCRCFAAKAGLLRTARRDPVETFFSEGDDR